MLWQPLNLTEVCTADTSVSACTPFAFTYLNLLVQLFGGYTHQNNPTSHSEKDKIEYDFIIVGAGSAGCVLANRLSANKNWKVLLLEAGPEEPDITLVPSLSSTLSGSSIDWRYRTEPNGKYSLSSGGRMNWPRGKVMGGSSSINSLIYVRGNHLDYDNWAKLGNEGWSYKDVLPLFKKSERNLNFEGLNRHYHGVHGEQPISRLPYLDHTIVMFVNAFHERGLPINDYNGASQIGTIDAQTFTQDGVRYSTNNAFIEKIRYKRKNLTVKVEAEVLEILISDRKTAYGVRYVKNNKVYTAYAKKEVIVSGGSLNSPKLLMLSGIGPKAHLSKLNIPVIQDLAVGENLQDHVSFLGPLIGLNKTASLIGKQELLDELCQYSKMKIKRGPLSGNGPINIGVFTKTDSTGTLEAPDIQINFQNAFATDVINNPEMFQLGIFPTSFYDSVFPRVQTMEPKSRGKLLLNATNPHGHILVYPNYLEDPEDLISLLRGTRFVLSLENTKVFREGGAYFIRKHYQACRDNSWGSDEYFICTMKHYTATSYHPVGTCKMGPESDPHAVVDPRLRVYGIRGLRVIDASIMPVIIRGNINAVAIMIGEKGAELIYEDWCNTLCQLINNK